ncbi:MAG TPA: rhodanese-like domain-containing protein [Candidatus Acidoferrum sp.]|nr:rhodanese-like domain-containing protein [Candidatus Acidoferrum sp.]
MKRLLARIQMYAVWVSVLALSLAVAAPLVAGSRITDVTVEQGRELMQRRAGQTDFIILDVRTPEEFAEGHLTGAVNLNLLAPDFAARLGAFDRGKTYLVYCRSGNRSTKAVQVMERLEFRSVSHMVEGILGWQKKGFPLSRTQ